MSELEDVVTVKNLETEHSLGSQEYADYLLRSKLAINASWCHSARPITHRAFPRLPGRYADDFVFTNHQLKGRVLEAAFARCALLETEGSPIGRWFPDDAYFTYANAEEARALIVGLSDAEITRAATRLHDYAVEHYHPRIIFSEILERAQQ